MSNVADTAVDFDMTTSGRKEKHHKHGEKKDTCATGSYQPTAHLFPL